MPRPSVERERKFLVDHVPAGLARFPHKQIQQGYLAIGPVGPEEVRIRRAAGRTVLTVKRGAGETRQEVEVPLPTAAARKLWPLTKGRRLSKTRYELPGRGGLIQVDVYGGPLRGLVIAEVERHSVRALRQFRPPAWFGREVTGRKAFSNSNLARESPPRSAAARGERYGLRP